MLRDRAVGWLPRECGQGRQGCQHVEWGATLAIRDRCWGAIADGTKLVFWYDWFSDTLEVYMTRQACKVRSFALTGICMDALQLRGGRIGSPETEGAKACSRQQQILAILEYELKGRTYIDEDGKETPCLTEDTGIASVGAIAARPVQPLEPTQDSLRLRQIKMRLPQALDEALHRASRVGTVQVPIQAIFRDIVTSHLIEEGCLPPDWTEPRNPNHGGPRRKPKPRAPQAASQ